MKNDTIKKARLAKGLTQQQVADRIGIARGTYNRIENGTPTSFKTMQKICRILNIEFTIK